MMKSIFPVTCSTDPDPFFRDEVRSPWASPQDSRFMTMLDFKFFPLSLVRF